MPDESENLRYWVALSTLNDIGANIIKKLISIYQSPEKIFNASFDELLQIDGIGKNRAESITSFCDWKRVDKILERIDRLKAKIIHENSKEYPVLLREIHGNPPILYVRGELKEEDKYAIAIVGSRKATHYGISATEKITAGLSELGFTIVSGLAIGIDTVAHKTALNKEARTAAVLGCGLDVVYPPQNKILMERIVEKGAVVSEFPPGTRPLKEHFPIRNRLISGMSLGVLVTEAAESSGSLITAYCALEQGREVFAVPGNIMSKTSAGTHKLIQNGVKLVQKVDDITRELAYVLKGFIKEEKKQQVQLQDQEKLLCNAISIEPAHIDDIIRDTGIPSSEVLTLLLGLELKGIVKQIDGKKFHLIC
ncbi:DNA protecting protein DprA [Candidatus Magnetoovum chiemensis]|nr:DNA protecting protein DprA [Candidatus Magnetoovum chiemensis]